MFDVEGLRKGLGLIAIFGGLYIIIIIIFYLSIAVFLNKLNKIIEGKKTIFAYLPIFNVYLLGKLTINKLVGFILALYFAFIIFLPKLPIYYQIKILTLIPIKFLKIITILYAIVINILSIYAIIKYFKLRKQNTQNIDSIPINYNQNNIQDLIQNNNQLSQNSTQNNNQLTQNDTINNNQLSQPNSENNYIENLYDK